MEQPNDYDVLIIGGGPAGSAAAAYCRKRGMATCVVEKEQFPRFHIGESLLPMGNSLLREMGVWPAVEAAGFIPKYGATFHTADGSATKHVDFQTSIIPGLDSTFQVERAKFDSLLLEHAETMGAAVFTKSIVRSVRRNETGSCEAAVESGGSTRKVTARWVLDGSGRDNLLHSSAKQKLDPSPFPKRVAIYGHFSGVSREEGRAAGNTVVVRIKNGWFWFIPIDSERTSIGLVTTVEGMREAKLAPEELFYQEVARSTKLTSLLAGAKPLAGFHVTSDYSYFRRDLAEGRSVLIGDAAGFFDPIFSSGVYMALWSAKLAVEMISRADETHREILPSEQKRYTRIVKRHASVFQKLIAAFYDEHSFSVFMCIQVPWNLSPGLTSIVAGHAKLTWPLWWRFHVFLTVCRAQRYLRVVQPLASPETESRAVN